MKLLPVGSNEKLMGLVLHIYNLSTLEITECCNPNQQIEGSLGYVVWPSKKNVKNGRLEV